MQAVKFTDDERELFRAVEACNRDQVQYMAGVASMMSRAHQGADLSPDEQRFLRRIRELDDVGQRRLFRALIRARDLVLALGLAKPLGVQ